MKNIRANNFKIRIGGFNVVYILIIINLVLNAINCSLFVRMTPQIGEVLGPVILINRFLCIFTWIIKAIYTRTGLKKTLLFVVFMLLVVAEYIYLRQWLLFDVFFMPIFFGEDLVFEKIRRIYLRCYIATVVVLALLSLTGMFHEYVFVRDDGSQRNSLGFLHPNLFGIAILCICYLFLLRRRIHTKKVDYFILPICAYFLWIIPNSMTSALLLFLAWIGIIIVDLIDYRNKRKTIRIVKNRAEKRKTRLIYIAIAVGVGVVIGIIYKGWGRDFLSSVSGTFYSRFVLADRAVRIYGFSWFGNKNIEFIGELDILAGRATANQYFALDCLFIYLPVVVGIIPTIAIVIIYALGIRKSVRYDNKIMQLILLLFVLSGVSDSIVISQLCGWLYYWTFSKTDEERRVLANTKEVHRI